ncbi:MAG: DNA adenine methylase [Ignavibacterium sp.]
MYIVEQKYAKPFLKWAGGKTQLLDQFSMFFPKELKDGKIENYYEPFLGSGAVFFFIAQNYNIKNAYLSDINEDLIPTFNVVKRNVSALIEELKKLKDKYYRLEGIERESFYYKIRERYNKKKSKIDFSRRDGFPNNYSSLWINRAAQMIFLNKTCYNGLFRLNKKGEFNVPFGRYKNPGINDEENLLRVSEVLQIAKISLTDFEKVKEEIKGNFFIYFDPPYRPISKTANFTSYSKYDFKDEDQIRLAQLYKKLGLNGNKLMLSNSDPKNENSCDNFFKVFISLNPFCYN